MIYRAVLLFLATLAFSLGAIAAESCGLVAAGLMVNGKTQELAELFVQPSEVADPLQRMAASLGKVTELQETPTPRFAKHKRVSIQSKDLPASYNFVSYRINGRSEKMGAFQFNVGRKFDSKCKLILFQLDTEI